MVSMPTKLLLTPDQANRTAFPPGCPVLYGFKRSAPPSRNKRGDKETAWEASEGVVQSVALDTERRRFMFRIAPRGEEAEGTSGPPGGEPDGAGSGVTLTGDLALEGDVCYDVGCPVTVAAREDMAGGAGCCPSFAFPSMCGPSAAAAAEVTEEEKPARGQVLCARPVFDDKSGAMVGVRYAVRYRAEGGRCRIEEGVAPGRLLYAGDGRDASGAPTAVTSPASDEANQMIANCNHLQESINMDTTNCNA